jgi:GTP-binding protein HflX
VFNKIDAVDDKSLPTRLVAEFPNSVAISALTGEGFDDLNRLMVKQVQDLLGAVKVVIPYDRQSLLQDCYDFGRVQKVEYREDGIYVEAEVVKEMREKLRAFAA